MEEYLTPLSSEAEHSSPYGIMALFDGQFSTDSFHRLMAQGRPHDQSILSSIKEAISNTINKGSSENETDYIVQISDDLKDSIHNGDIKLVTNSDGEIFAQLLNSDGKYGQKLSIKEELRNKDISSQAAEHALQMEAIRIQLERIVDSIEQLENSVSRVIDGQQNDRIALYYSGLSLYIEAQSVQEPTLRYHLLAQAIHSFNEAAAKMIQEIRSDIEYLSNRLYLKAKKGMRDSIDSKITHIRQCSDAVYRISFTKAYMYYENNEVQALLSSLDQYKRFIEKMISPHLGMLSELDKNDMLFDTGAWGKIVKSIEDCNRFQDLLVDNHTYYLETGENTNG
ncbi:MAG: hypothetical protein IKZ41_07375 [Clostridia bacterium]|nr:hypothetical protein [Clostridia bacterium]MBR5365534.1 hypothetical protein [Clostridia bacterium]